MSSYRRRYSKRELLGSLHVDYIMSVSDLGLFPNTNRWDVLRAFLQRGEARAERLVEDKDGFLILQSIPGRRNTGAIYVYHERLGAFFWLSFGDREDDLSGEDFQNALRIYRLVRFVADGPRHRHRDRYRRHAAGPDSSRRNVFIPTIRTLLVSTPPITSFIGSAQTI
jgi:hypothetical protein